MKHLRLSGSVQPCMVLGRSEVVSYCARASIRGSESLSGSSCWPHSSSCWPTGCIEAQVKASDSSRTPQL